MAAGAGGGSADGVAYLNAPQRIEVRCDAAGLPVRLRLRNRWQEVARVVDVWRVDDEWWTRREVSRLYVRLLVGEGRPLTLFRDLSEGTWWQQRY